MGHLCAVLCKRERVWKRECSKECSENGVECKVHRELQNAICLERWIMENFSGCKVYWLWLHQRVKEALGVKIISGISGIKCDSVKASRHRLISPQIQCQLKDSCLYRLRHLRWIIGCTMA